ncbi:hypothetical protein RFI_31732 [Reticulomyxa filosa]|uniref:AD domain-containing protein n=1 Tax=Reticulomyxa filosa TaxID=46433 RepID=X6LUQ5_RETFI|nr:hypothetical protein RFI_31732 [Reticulomyxa filosa]|eukprot:ETO05668.1 hypothetical protein RFI_31732 [Reticulomyxa filosa]
MSWRTTLPKIPLTSKVKVSLIKPDKKILEGILFGFDPVTYSIILQTSERDDATDENTLLWLNGDTICDISITDESTNKNQNEQKTDSSNVFAENILSNAQKILNQSSDGPTGHYHLSSDDKETQLKLVKYLQEQHIPADIKNDDIVIGNNVRIIPPYDHKSVYSSNETIFARILPLLTSFHQKNGKNEGTAENTTHKTTTNNNSPEDLEVIDID